MSKVHFFSQGSALVGELHLPRATTGRVPAIVVAGSWLTVKEQMSAQYAPRLAAQGFAALSFDFRGFGASEGAPREVESPWSKAEDLLNAAAFLRTLPGIDPDRIGMLGICASAGYASLALAAGAPYASAAFVAPWFHDAGMVRELYGGDEAVQQRLEAARAARAKYAQTGVVDYVPAASNSDASAAMYMPGDLLDYYLNPERGRIASWGGRFATMAWTEWLTFDPIALAPRLTTPIRLVTSEQSATPAGARRFDAALGAEHDSIWMQGTQFDFYDQPAVVAAAAKHAVEHFQRTLKSRTEVSK